MEYTDQELTTWWSNKSENEKDVLFDTILENADVASFESTVSAWKRKFYGGEALSSSALATLRRWDH